MKFLLNLLILGAVSSCSFGCAYPNAPLSGRERDYPPSDPNQGTIRLMEQRTFNRAMDLLEGEIKGFPRQNVKQCPVQEELNCNQLLDQYQQKCGVISPYNLG